MNSEGPKACATGISSMTLIFMGWPRHSPEDIVCDVFRCESIETVIKFFHAGVVATKPNAEELGSANKPRFTVCNAKPRANKVRPQVERELR